MESKRAVSYDYFPTIWQAVLWRNWGHVPVENLARVLLADEATLRREAEMLGFDPDAAYEPMWRARGYITTIRENWHLLTTEQLTDLLDISRETLDFLLKEDDFLLVKLGGVKPAAEEARYRPLTPAQREKTDAIRAMARQYLACGDNAFAFIRRFMRPVTPEERAAAQKDVLPDETLRTVYSYFALYGDPLIDPSLDPFPEALLMEYAKMGVKGVWLQGVLYQLVRFPFAPEMSEGCQTRMRNLNELIRRAARYGIGVYLYFNEPRSMTDAFFQKYPELRGRREDDFYAMCTSTEPVRAYLEDAAYRLFDEAKGLAGFFTITMSENLTNCYSRGGAEGMCPRCAGRKPEEVIAEVNNLLARGAHRANPAAKAIAWNWAWGEEWAEKVPPLLTENQIVQCTSEERLPTRIGGVDGYVTDYTMSLCGPGPKAKKVWRAALAAGRECCAKVQFNNTWEMSAAPWLPVMDKVARHVQNLRDAGVKHLQLSWTLGGYPSPNLRLASWLMSGKGDVSAFLRDWLGDTLGGVADAAQKQLSEAFGSFPFHIQVLYHGPQNCAPMAPFFLKKTEWKSSMVGYPYDDLDGWRSMYPRDVFLAQWENLVAGWTRGVEEMLPYKGENADFDDMANVAEAALCHFRSTRNHVLFVMARDMSDKAGMLRAVRAERETVLRVIALRRADSRIGYEASNHYYYSAQDLVEKLVNLRAVEDEI